jgi:hypothetical protein
MWPAAAQLAAHALAHNWICHLHVSAQVFKRYMDAFLGPLFACLACQHQLCRTAAGRCAGALRDSVGPGIFAGHLTEEQAVLLGNSPDVPAPKGGQRAFSCCSLQRYPPAACEAKLAGACRSDRHARCRGSVAGMQ